MEFKPSKCEVITFTKKTNRVYVFRVATHLENLEKSGNSKVVRAGPD